MRGTLLHNGLEYPITYQHTPGNRPVTIRHTFTKSYVGVGKKDSDSFAIQGEGLPTDIARCTLQAESKKLYQLTVVNTSPYGDRIFAVGVPYTGGSHKLTTDGKIIDLRDYHDE